MLHTFPKEDFQREYNILKSLIPDGLMELLKRLDVRVAGGTLTSLFSNREVNDIDLYFPSWENLEVFLAYMTDRGLLSGDSDLTPATNNWGNSKRSFKYFRELDQPGSFQDYVNVLACKETKRPPTKASADKLALLAKDFEECSDEIFKKIESFVARMRRLNILKISG
ncbi:DNA gyrase subunit A [Salmonella phage 41]|nr:DNA gyrase subunit A [Salmonella phage 41]